MGRYRKTRRMEASREQVFQAFTDPAIVADWMEADGIVDQRGSLDAVGSTYTLVIAGPWRFRQRVTRSVPPAEYEIEGRGPLGTTSRIGATITSDGQVTELVVDTAWTLPFGPIGRWIDRRWVQPGTRGEEDRELDRLVDIVTGRDWASSTAVVRGGRRAREREAEAAKLHAVVTNHERPG